MTGRILLGLFIAIVVWLVVTYTKPSHAPLTQIKIIATYQHVEPQELQAIITPFLEAGFFYINMHGLQKAIQQLPWVQSAYVQRVWPQGLTVKIMEQEAAAVWNHSALLNAAGNIFKPDPSTFPPQLSVLSGPPDAAQQVFTKLQEIQQLLTPIKLYVRELTMTPQHFWQVVVNDGITIYLGDTDIEKRLTTLVNLYPKIIAAQHTVLESIDLRYSNGIAVK